MIQKARRLYRSKELSRSQQFKKGIFGLCNVESVLAFGTGIKGWVISKGAVFLPARSVEVQAGDHLPSNKIQDSSFA